MSKLAREVKQVPSGTIHVIAGPLEVELPVCDVCLHVGKHPGQRRMQFDCTGPPGAIHKRARMQNRLFREVLVETEIAA